MKSSRQIVIQQPTNKKYLVEKTTKFEMIDQNDNQTESRHLKEEPFLIEQHQVDDEPKRTIINCSDGILELDENGNPIEEKKRVKRGLKSSVIKHRHLSVFDSIDSPILNQATNIGTTVGRKTLSAIDYVGQMFASIIGITGPKYENEIAQAHFENKEKKRRANVIREAEAGWK